MKETKDNTFYKIDGLIFPGVLMFVVLSIIALIPIISTGHYFYSVIPIAIIVFSFSGYRITEIDFNQRKYREGYMFFGKRNGEWKTIFDFTYVSIVGKDVKTQHSRTLGPMSNPTGNTDAYGVYEIRLFKSISQRIILFTYPSHKKALEAATIVCKGLESKLLDATQQPPVFLIE